MNGPNWAEGLDAIASCITAIVTALGIYFALRESKSWKAKLAGQSEYEVARKIMESLLKVRYLLLNVRNPVMYAHEMAPEKDEEAKLDKSPKIEKYESQVRGYDRRWKRVAEAMIDFETCLMQGEALWDGYLEEEHKALRKHYAELFVTLQSWLEYLGSRSESHDRDPNYERTKKWEKIVYAVKDDQGNDAFDIALQEITYKFKTKLKSKMIE